MGRFELPKYSLKSFNKNGEKEIDFNKPARIIDINNLVDNINSILKVLPGLLVDQKLDRSKSKNVDLDNIKSTDRSVVEELAKEAVLYEKVTDIISTKSIKNPEPFRLFYHKDLKKLVMYDKENWIDVSTGSVV